VQPGTIAMLVGETPGPARAGDGLRTLRRELKAVIESCDGGIVADCRMIEARGPHRDRHRSC